MAEKYFAVVVEEVVGQNSVAVKLERRGLASSAAAGLGQKDPPAAAAAAVEEVVTLAG